jgi:hypothetical protein
MFLWIALDFGTVVVLLRNCTLDFIGCIVKEDGTALE